MCQGTIVLASIWLSNSRSFFPFVGRKLVTVICALLSLGLSNVGCFHISHLHQGDGPLARECGIKCSLSRLSNFWFKAYNSCWCWVRNYSKRVFCMESCCFISCILAITSWRFSSFLLRSVCMWVLIALMACGSISGTK